MGNLLMKNLINKIEFELRWRLKWFQLTHTKDKDLRDKYFKEMIAIFTWNERWNHGKGSKIH